LPEVVLYLGAVVTGVVVVVVLVVVVSL